MSLAVNVVTPTDSLVIPSDKPIAFPRTSDAANFIPPADYLQSEMINFHWNDTEGLRKMIGNKYSLRAHLVRVPEDSVTSWMLVADSSETVWGQVPKLRLRTPRPSLEVVLRVLERVGWNLTEAGRILEVHRNSLRVKLARWGVRGPGGER